MENAAEKVEPEELEKLLMGWSRDVLPGLMRKWAERQRTDSLGIVFDTYEDYVKYGDMLVPLKPKEKADGCA